MSKKELKTDKNFVAFSEYLSFRTGEVGYFFDRNSDQNRLLQISEKQMLSSMYSEEKGFLFLTQTPNYEVIVKKLPIVMQYVISRMYGRLRIFRESKGHWDWESGSHQTIMWNYFRWRILFLVLFTVEKIQIFRIFAGW